jgi:hypothetical protein
MGERQGERATEGQPHDVGLAEAERVDEPGQAVGVAGHAEVLRRVGRAAGAGCIPGDDRERVREVVELGAPRRRPVADVAVQQHQRRPMAGALVGDPLRANLDDVHGPTSAATSGRILPQPQLAAAARRR